MFLRQQRLPLHTITMLWLVLFLPLSQGRADDVRQQAHNLEKQGRWFEACCLYDELLSKDRTHTELREAYRRCLRHFRQERRLQDEMLQSLLSKLTPSEATDLYVQVFDLVVKKYADGDKADRSTLFQQGLHELREATRKKAFQQRHAGRVSEGDLAALRATLDEFVGERITSTARAREAIRKIVIAGSQLGLPPGILALECASGAANSLDEYSLYLSPGRMSQAQAALKNKVVGIGIELSLVGQRLEVSRVYRKSPAEMVGMLKGDRIIRIDGMWVNPLAPDLAVERLLGEAGTSVEIEYIRSGQTMTITEKIERQLVVPVSAEGDVLPVSGEKDAYIGYLHIHSFQDSTFQEVKEILARWQMMPMPLRGIIIDLRGNPGGLFKSALNVAELFLPESVIVQTISRVPGLSRVYESHNVSPCPLPLAVLVDGETASAAELLAGALKENKRADLIGQPTYGKHSIQNVYPLERGPGGLRLTVARFTSPSGSPFSSKGIQPKHPVTNPDAMVPKAVEVILGAMQVN